MVRVDELQSMPYAGLMKRLLIWLALACLASVPALACTPRDPETYSDREIVKEANERVRSADAIVDGVVIDGKDGIYLKPIKVWKGKPVRRYYIQNAYCGVILLPGDKVRALLVGDAPEFMMMSPMPGRKWDSKLYDKVIDDHLGAVRPNGYENGSATRLAPPLKKRG